MNRDEREDTEYCLRIKVRGKADPVEMQFGDTKMLIMPLFTVEE